MARGSRILGLAAVLALMLAPAAWGAAALDEPRYSSSWEEYSALKAKANGGAKHTAATLPDWRGIWRRRTPPNMGFSFDTDAGPNTTIGPPYGLSSAKLTPKYQADYDIKMKRLEQGFEVDRLTYCLPAGMPRWLADPMLREFIPTPEQTWLLYEQLQEIRRVYTDGRDHIPDSVAIPLWQGDSIGFWDRDTLIVHTKHMKAGDYMRGQPNYSFKVTTVERWRKVDPNTIEVKATVYDPESLAEPYKATFRYVKVADPQVRVNYNSCEEGNNAIVTPDGATTFVLPGEPGYRDPATFGIPAIALDTLPK